VVLELGEDPFDADGNGEVTFGDRLDELEDPGTALEAAVDLFDRG
jgi:hypothetical protein